METGVSIGILQGVIQREAEDLETVRSAMQSTQETLEALKQREAELAWRVEALEEILLTVTKRG